MAEILQQISGTGLPVALSLSAYGSSVEGHVSTRSNVIRMPSGSATWAVDHTRSSSLVENTALWAGRMRDGAPYVMSATLAADGTVGGMMNQTPASSDWRILFDSEVTVAGGLQAMWGASPSAILAVGGSEIAFFGDASKAELQGGSCP